MIIIMMKTIRATKLYDFILAEDDLGNCYKYPCEGIYASKDDYSKAAAELCRKMGWVGTLAHGIFYENHIFILIRRYNAYCKNVSDNFTMVNDDDDYFFNQPMRIRQ
jgi:hypothetical protein